jgi:hypothetical protein
LHTKIAEPHSNSANIVKADEKQKKAATGAISAHGRRFSYPASSNAFFLLKY